MKLTVEYTLTYLGNTETFKWPITFEQDSQSLTIREPDGDGRSRAHGALSVAVDGLSLCEYATPRGAPRLWAVVVPGAQDLANWIEDCVHLVTFATDVPIRRASHPSRLEPEDDADRVWIEENGTDRVFQEITATPIMRTFDLHSIDRSQFTTLMARSAGLHLYSHAILVQDDQAAFRDLWRVLESAFGEQDEKLVDLLADFQPARDLEFEKSELKALLVVRGRISHAKTRRGVEEIRAARGEASERLPRLKALAEQVLVGKKTWGTKAVGAARITPLTGFVGPQRGAITTFRK